MWYIQLKNYAEWYYTKYFPSRKKLLEKLLSKESEREVVDRVMNDLSSLIVEEQNVESRVHAWIQAGKTEQYIKTKLLQKKFDTDIVRKTLETYESSFSSPDIYRGKIEQFIEKRKRQHSSRHKIQYELRSLYPDLKSLIEEMLADYDDEEALIEKIPALLKKYPQEKVVQKCSVEGFRTSDIYAALRRL